MINLEINEFSIFLLLLIAGMAICVCIITWSIYLWMGKRTKNKALKLIRMAGWNLLLFLFLCYIVLPIAARKWAFTKSLDTVDTFMTFLHQGEYRSAQDMILNFETNEPDRWANLQLPENKPVTWDLEITGYHFPSYIATGSVVLPNGKEASAIVIVNWTWEAAAWKINLVMLQQFDTNHDISPLFIASEVTDENVLMNAGAFLVVLGSILFSLRDLLRISKSVKENLTV